MLESGLASAHELEARVLLLTTAHNEARFVEGLVDAVCAQTRRPDRWVIVDDGSTDETFAALRRRVAGIEWITLMRRPVVAPRPVDRLAVASVPRALNHALATLEWRHFTHIGKIDADVVLPPRFLEKLLVSTGTEKCTAFGNRKVRHSVGFCVLRAGGVDVVYLLFLRVPEPA